MSSTGATANQSTWWHTFYGGLQKMGRSLQLPVAVLPAAGLLTRLGQDDIFGKDGLGWNKVSAAIGAAGGALLNPALGLPLLFCIGVAIGMAKKADGSTALAAVAGFLVYYAVLHAFPKDCPTGSTLDGTICVNYTDKTVVSADFQNPGVLGGILMGLFSAWLWVRYHRVRLVDWLGFFNGRRLVPMITALVGLLLGSLMVWIWQPIGSGLEDFSKWLSDLDAVGSGIFGVANRALLLIGMHQLLNTFVWFQFGSYTNPDTGKSGTGDIGRFLAGDPDAGQFLSGFFPIMMFALPAAAMAIAACAKPHRRKEIYGLMTSVALTSFVTGVTEPIEYSFAYVAPLLYGIHAVLTGVSMAVTWALGVHDGFSFSAGLIDYLLNWNLATKPWLIIPIGLCFAVVYYAVFRFVIVKFNLKTPGREDDDEIDDVTKA
ncbi:PTS system N-acetylglucosamine-specific IIC component [Kitasatospora sp. SolWspMP-SS2h]|uniref:PTS transporter subunit EIIC n=1 Tax=Kitasatospora sp. SolWspMP-SS2h TaxID=1305729 RepID=UPI000DB9D5B0|nr:PTS transporter subunit EIIC [Kitasatospora sp. SolWspMP-SS2h]RAJ43151.1 PTS system N-acetylglucosamine-specific IIC component [Kitasatospora sp. SolWspMP-SS2h]